MPKIPPAPLKIVKFDWIASAGLSVALAGAKPETLTLPPGGGAHWMLEITRTVDALAAGHVEFLLDYSSTEAALEARSQRTAHAVAMVDRIAPAELEKVIEVHTESSIKLLQEPRSSLVFVVVKNKADYPVVIHSIEFTAPTDIAAVWKNGAHDTTLAARHERAFMLEVKAKDAVQSGKHLLLFAIDANWRDAGSAESGSLLTKYEFDVGVLGESEMLTAIGVPTFLLLPGFLMILLFAMLWNHIGKNEALPIDLKSGEFWSLAILLSLASMLIYPWISKRNYLEGYGLTDVRYVWFGSAAVGVVGWAAAVLTRTAWRWLQGKQRLRRTFSATDSELETLRKLALNSRGFRLKQAEVKFGEKAVRALLLHEGGEGEVSWVAPSIGLKSRIPSTRR